MSRRRNRRLHPTLQTPPLGTDYMSEDDKLAELASHYKEIESLLSETLDSLLALDMVVASMDDTKPAVFNAVHSLGYITRAHRVHSYTLRAYRNCTPRGQEGTADAVESARELLQGVLLNKSTLEAIIHSDWLIRRAYRRITVSHRAATLN